MRKKAGAVVSSVVGALLVTFQVASAQAWTSDPYYDPRIPAAVLGATPSAGDLQAAMEAVIAIPMGCGDSSQQSGDNYLDPFRQRVAAHNWQMPAEQVMAHLAMTETHMSLAELNVLMYGLASMGSSEAQARLAALHQWAGVIAERFLSPNIPSEYRAGVLDGRTRGIRAAIVAAASDYGLQVTP